MRRQAIIWTNADLVHWCIYAVLGGDELNQGNWQGKSQIECIDIVSD